MVTEHLETLTKVVLYAGLLALVGSPTAFWLARASGDADDRRRLWTVGTVAASAVVVFLFLRLAAHTWGVFGSDGAFLEHLQAIGLRSRWGTGWRLQTMAAALALCLVTWARYGHRHGRGAVLATLGAVGLAAAYSRTGHSAGSMVTGAVATMHMVAGGAWLGALAVLVVTSARGTIWSRFSNVAMAGAGTVVLSGLILSISYFTSWRDLLGTAYGRIFLFKIVLFLAIAACGFLNWQQVRAFPRSLDMRPHRAWLEVALAIALLVATAFLTETEHPSL